MHLSIVPVFVHFWMNFPNVVVLQLGIAFERKYLPFLKVKQKSIHLIVATFIVSILKASQESFISRLFHCCVRTLQENFSAWFLIFRMLDMQPKEKYTPNSTRRLMNSFSWLIMNGACQSRTAEPAATSWTSLTSCVAPSRSSHTFQ